MKPWQTQLWCLPAIDATFIARMEDLLDLYEQPYDPERPLVCIDEKPVQLVGESRRSRRAIPGRPKRVDYEYRRLGTRNLFVLFDPKAGWRHITVTKQRKTSDFAEQLRFLVEEKYQEATTIRLVCDNLNTHKVASLCRTFPAEQARRIAEKIEWHYTPVHAFWLNRVELNHPRLEVEVFCGRRDDWKSARAHSPTVKSGSGGSRSCPSM